MTESVPFCNEPVIEIITVLQSSHHLAFRLLLDYLSQNLTKEGGKKHVAIRSDIICQRMERGNPLKAASYQILVTFRKV